MHSLFGKHKYFSTFILIKLYFSNLNDKILVRDQIIGSVNSLISLLSLRH